MTEALTHPAYGLLRPVSAQASVLLADNPGPMTLEGTNSYVLRAPGSESVVVVDPGPDDAEHLAKLSRFAPVELVLITHRHVDHTGGARAFYESTGAPVRAIDPEFCFGADPLQDGDILGASGVSIQVLTTPGHTSDSTSFVLQEDRGAAGQLGSVLTGDTVLGRGTTVIVHPDGAVGPYLASLERLHALGALAVLPAHGPDLPDISAVTAEYRAHRKVRLDAIRAVLDQLGPNATVEQVTDAVYVDIDPSVRGAAEVSVRAQLDYLRG